MRQLVRTGESSKLGMRWVACLVQPVTGQGRTLYFFSEPWTVKKKPTYLCIVCGMHGDTSSQWVVDGVVPEPHTGRVIQHVKVEGVGGWIEKQAGKTDRHT